MSLYGMTVPDKEFYQEFGRLEGKIDQLLEQNKQDREARVEKEKQDREDWSKLEGRVQTVERSQWRMGGAAFVLSSLVGLLARLWK